MKPITFSNRKRIIRLFTFAILGLVVTLPAIQAYTAINYSDPNDPYFAGNFAAENLKLGEALTIVSYNIWFGEDIDQALSEMKEIESQNELDIRHYW